MKKNLFKLSLVLFFVFFGFLLAGKVKAEPSDAVKVNLRVETATQTLFNGDIDVAPCSVAPEQTATSTNGLCALEQSGLTITANWQWSPAAFITSIGGVSEDATSSIYWLWFSDLNIGETGINQHALAAGEHLLFVLGAYPLKISAVNSSPFDGATTTISVLQFDPVVFDWIPAPNATIDFGYGATTTDINGQVDITATSSAPFSVSAAKTNFLSSNILNITPQAAYANITIRDGATVAFSGAVLLPASNNVPADISPTSATNTVAVPARSLLSVLKTVDAAQNGFAVTDLQYYDSLDSFFINCITMAAEANSLCGSWQYILNGVDPGVGTDHALLKNGDTVFLYFGNQRQVSLSTTTATVGAPFTATAQKYDPVNNVYLLMAGATIGVTQPDPNNPWSPIEIATSTVDANGQAVFTLNTAGTYNVGIKEDFYFPLTTLTVASSSPAGNQTSNQSNKGGSVIISGGGAVASPIKVNLNKAIDFLISRQNADGSFNSSLQTDWAAIALASVNPNSLASQKIKSYLLTDPNPLVGMNSASDYARRAMALMSLNINPYNGVKTNYVKKIIDLFDGQQFGDSALFNDDIFALLVLNKAGYGADQEIIKQAAAFIISKQKANGLWDSIDLTAAAMQALNPLSTLIAAAPALEKAKVFLSTSQGADGGFGDTYATSWAMQAIASLGENSANWQKNNKTPESYLALSQGADGGLEKDNSYEANRVWATAYAIPAVSGKPWFNILSSFIKEDPLVDKKAAAGNSNQANNLMATSTLEKSDLVNSSAQPLITVSGTESRPEIKSEEKKAATEAAKAVKISVKKAERLIPKVLGAAVVLPKIINQKSNQAGEKSNQETELKKTAPAQDSNSFKASAEDNGNMVKAAAKEKNNAAAKKVFYAAGVGAVLAGVFLLLKLLGFLL